MLVCTLRDAQQSVTLLLATVVDDVAARAKEQTQRHPL
jgi:hypothetical protein